MDNLYLYKLYARANKCCLTVCDIGNGYEPHFHSKDDHHYYTPAKYEFYIPLVERYLRRFYPNTGMFHHNKIIMDVCSRIARKHRYLYSPSIKALQESFFNTYMINGVVWRCYEGFFQVIEMCTDQTILDLLYKIHNCGFSRVIPDKNEITNDAKVTKYLIPTKNFSRDPPHYYTNTD